MKKILITAFALSLAAPALAAQQDIAQLSAITASREALRTAINTQLSAVQANFDEVYAVIDAGPVYVNASAPADTKVVWIDTDQDNAIKAYIGSAWTVVGTAGSGDDLGSAAYTDVVALWTTCTGYLKSDGTCDTPSGSATYPSAAGVANWGGSAWGTSYTVGTGASNLVQLNASAQLPAVSADLLTITDTGTYFTTDTVGAAMNQLGSELAEVTQITLDASLTETGGVLSVTNPVPAAITMNSGGDLATTGTITSAVKTTAIDTDATLSGALEYGAMTFNTAASTRTLTVTAGAGKSGCFRNAQGVAQILRIDATDGDYIVKPTGARTSASGEYYGATADAKNQVCWVSYDNDDIYITSEVGTWTEQE